MKLIIDHLSHANARESVSIAVSISVFNRVDYTYFEEQALALQSLNQVAKTIALQICLRQDIKAKPSDATVVIFDQTTFANIGAYSAFVANA
jgi:hypothetical protein